MQHVMTARVAAAQATVDAWKGKPFVWGEYDCARLAAYNLKQLGYAPRISRFGYYRSALSATRALRREGFTDVGGWMDSLGLPRIAQAAALPGDILGFGHDDMPLRVGLGVALGNGRMLAFLADQVCHVVDPRYGADGADYYAWSAKPCRS